VVPEKSKKHACNRVEEKLTVSEEKYRKLFEETLDAIFVAEAETGILIDCNRAAQELVGRDKTELLGKPNGILFPEKENDGKINRTFKKLRKTLGSSIRETQVITKNGEIKDVSIKASVFEVEGKRIVQGLFRDITESKRMEDALRQEHYRLEAVTDSIGSGFVIISKDYRVLWANKFIKQLKGDTEGKLCFATLNDLSAPCPDCGVKKVFEQGIAADSHEYTSTNIQGNPYWVEIIATPIKNKDGHISSAVEIVFDITEKKSMQRKLADYSQNLENLVDERTEQLKQTQAKLIQSERLAAIGHLAGMVGHDLRNPLTGIKNASYYLKKKGSSCLDKTSMEMLEIIDKAVEHANRITSDLLDYSREIHLDLRKCSPETLIQEALAMVPIPNRIKVVTHTISEPMIAADIDKVRRVFINLIKNAVDAMSETGTLEITSCQKDNSVEFTFVDTGIGMTDDVKAKIFTPLFTTKAQGMGFGLSICNRIVDAHGGKITVESSVSKGTTFTVTLPIKPQLESQEKVWVQPQESLMLTTTKA
jgi:PAS domain S-box-containing protein